MSYLNIYVKKYSQIPQQSRRSFGVKRNVKRKGERVLIWMFKTAKTVFHHQLTDLCIFLFINQTPPGR